MQFFFTPTNRKYKRQVFHNRKGGVWSRMFSFTFFVLTATAWCDVSPYGLLLELLLHRMLYESIACVSIAIKLNKNRKYLKKSHKSKVRRQKQRKQTSDQLDMDMRQKKKQLITNSCFLRPSYVSEEFAPALLWYSTVNTHWKSNVSPIFCAVADCMKKFGQFFVLFLLIPTKTLRKRRMNWNNLNKHTCMTNKNTDSTKERR